MELKQQKDFILFTKVRLYFTNISKHSNLFDDLSAFSLVLSHKDCSGEPLDETGHDLTEQTDVKSNSPSWHSR